MFGNGKWQVDSQKAQGLLDWPDPRSCDDIVSFRGYVNLMKDIIPPFHPQDQCLLKFTKKGAKFALF